MIASESGESWIPDGQGVTAAAPTGRRAGLHTASKLVLGASIAALALGSVLGAMASTDAGRLQNEKSKLTVAQGRELASSSSGKAGAANALWIAGGLGAIAGGVGFAFTLPEPRGAR